MTEPATGRNPVTKLTDAENTVIDQINNDPSMTPEKIVKELKAILQAAATVELATIPIYLYTYYSINRQPDSNKSLMDPPGGYQGNPSAPHIPNSVSGNRAQKIQVYANQAGAAIMSVAVEEMLHMSLASNVLFALGEDPQLYGKSPWPYPCNLPAHANLGPNQEPMKLSLGPLSYEHLWQFLEIEWPETPGAMPQPGNFETIGQVYSYVRCLMHAEKFPKDAFANARTDYQIQPDYYAPNNVDTIFAKGSFNQSAAPPSPVTKTVDEKAIEGDSKAEQKKINVDAAASTTVTIAEEAATVAEEHKTKTTKGYDYPNASAAASYENAPDSHAGAHELLTIHDIHTAQQAIATICDQGEGFNPGAINSWDDLATMEEDSHFYKFALIQAELEKPPNYDEPWKKGAPQPPVPENPITAGEQSYFVYPYPVNPSTANYSDPVHQAVSNACNALYQYMLILTETTFLAKGKEQKQLFYQGMHMSMIWILDKLVQAMRTVPLNDGTGQVLAATFENIDLGDRSESYASMCAYAEAALTAVGSNSEYTDVAGYLKKFASLPDVGPLWYAYESKSKS